MALTVPDVVVVGGGPAGASTAFALARVGIRVTVLDRAHFPRPKPCAEYLSPEASRVLDAMGALGAIEASGAAQLTGVVVRAPDGGEIRGEFVAAHAYRAFRDRGLSVRREVLDAILLDRARTAGATVVEGARVAEVLRADGRATGVEFLDGTGARHRLDARMVVGADGLRSVVARRLGLSRRARWFDGPRRLAVVSHFADVTGLSDVAEMHVERDGYVGIADVGHGVATVALVVPASAAVSIGSDRAGFLRAWLDARPQLRGRFTGATPVSPAVVTGPFASRARCAHAPGALLVGDAADFFDPFTGEGVFAALRGGELAADALVHALAASTPAGAVAAQRDYERRRREVFGGKWLIERAIAAVVGSPALINRAAASLGRRRDLADLLIGVTGDFVPPAEVLRLRYVLGAFGLPFAGRA